jgi:hypothetical protein
MYLTYFLRTLLNGGMTVSKTTIGIKSLSKMTLSINGLFATLSINNTQHNDIQHKQPSA